jgi:hypothetical protein
MKKILFLGLGVLIALSSCKNQDWEFPNYDYQTVYFANQFPIRTLTFGEDHYDTSFDNQGKLQIMATTGGVYNTFRDVTIDIEVDNSLCNNLKYGVDATLGGGRDILPMPANYYSLASDKITIPKGQLIGGVEVQLTDAYFNDPLAKNVNYVIPIKMTRVLNADSILFGKSVPSIVDPNPAIIGHWESNMAPKNFTMYAVKYINTWHGNYLRRGIDNIMGKNGHTELTRVDTRRNIDIERDELKAVSTENRQVALLPLTFQGISGANVAANLKLTFDDEGNCTINSANGTFTASGTGKFIKKGEKNSWGNQDRDALYLEYTIDLADMQISTKDTLVIRDRGVKLDVFSPTLN